MFLVMATLALPAISVKAFAATVIATLAHWDVSHVSNANKAFVNALKFAQEIGSWDVSNVTDMSSMFKGAIFFDQDIGSWDVSKVTDMCLTYFSK
jgi:surface protein